MADLIGTALSTADLPKALAKHAVGWGDYVRARREDPAFEVACQEIDLVVRHALVIQLEALAAAGDMKAARLLAGGLAEIRAALAEQGAGASGPAAEAEKIRELASAREANFRDIIRRLEHCERCQRHIKPHCKWCAQADAERLG